LTEKLNLHNSDASSLNDQISVNEEKSWRTLHMEMYMAITN